ncbi:MAG: ComEC family competence protein [Crocinitomicaceae bacterium]|nr:ComEC family competence protein [Crocinitomicaceae bacterium]
MLYVWKRSPFLRLIFPLVCGIFLSDRFHLPLNIVFPLYITLFFSSLLCHTLFPRIYLHHAAIQGGLTISLIFVFGCTIYSSHDPKIHRSHFAHHIGENTVLLVQLTDNLQKKERSSKVVAEVKEVYTAGKTIITGGQLLLYLPADTSVMRVGVDDFLAVRCNPVPVEGPSLPGQFDYKNYLKHQHIIAQAFVKAGDWSIIDQQNERSIHGAFIRLRDKMIGIFSKSGIAGDELSVLSALVLGKSYDLDKEVLSDYSASGTVHILAVSGLHVGLIYLLLTPVVRFLLPGKSRRIYRALLPTLLLWAYAALTGFSPSVMRAAVMFTFFIVAESFEKKNNSFNTLSASALLLLSTDPHLLFSVGFQLSYLAVAGIVIFQKPLTDLLYIRNKWLAKGWQLSTVSIAAQLTTLPLTLFYFHQFPNYFLFANLLMIPLSTVLLYSAIGFMALHCLPWIGPLLSQLLSFLTRLLNGLATFFGHLPGAVTENIVFSSLQLIAFCAVLLFITRFFLWKIKYALFPAMIFLGVLFIFSIAKRHEKRQMEEFVFFPQGNGFCISWLQQEKAYCIISDTAAGKDIARRLLPYWQLSGARESKIFSFDESSIAEDRPVFLLPPFLVCGPLVTMVADSSHFPLMQEIDLLILDRSLQRHYFTAAEIASLDCAQKIVGCGLSQKKLSFLNSRLPEEKKICSSSDGFLLYNSSGWQSVRKKRTGIFE